MMFQSLTHNLFEDIKVEPLNYYVNSGNESYTHQSSSMMCSAYKDDISKINMSYDGLPITSKEKTVYEVDQHYNIFIETEKAGIT